MSVLVHEVRPGFYLDSVALMRLSVSLQQAASIEDASMMTGTPANIEILMNAGLLDGEIDAGPEDLVIAIRAQDRHSADAALATATSLLADASSASTAGAVARPRSMTGAVAELAQANLALVSVPGPFAVREARKALDAGLNVMIFSDNVPLEDELALKQKASEQGLIVMGPDCGTAIVGGVPLAFANVVPRGDVGIVAASGTGLQEVTCLLARAGRGISHAIGTGGRDVGDGIGGITALAAIQALARDADTREIVFISKPAGENTRARLVAALEASGKPWSTCFLGDDRETTADGTRYRTLTDTSNALMTDTSPATAIDAAKMSAARSRLSANATVSGLYTGGTLCSEAQLVLLDHGFTVASNVPVPGAGNAGPEVIHGKTNVLLDLGADEYTVGRPHPMIEPAIRNAELERLLASDLKPGLVLLDLVTGFGAHAEPAAELVNIIAGHPETVFVASVCGTNNDPQSRAQQVALLEQVGVMVAGSNAQAAMAVAALLSAA